MTQISRLSIDNNGFFKDTIGDSGIEENQLSALSPKLDKLRQTISEWRESDAINLLNLPDKNGMDEIKRIGLEKSNQFKHTIIFGIGGSSLGGEMLVHTLGRRNASDYVKFYDNVDPTTLEALNDVDWRETLLLVISKSGNTAETLSQFLAVLPRMQRHLGDDGVKQHTLIITENTGGALYQVGQRLGIQVIPHPAIGGRFSVLSIVGLLPAYIGGVDIDGVVEGARAMAEQCTHADLEKNPAFFNGAAQYLHAEQGRTISVFMPYADNLRLVVNWYRQLWAESLGKIDVEGNNKGMTPVEAHGVTDQHSQLQLLLHGPDDKQITLLANPGVRHQGLRIPMQFQDLAAIQPLVGHTIGELFISELRATRTTLSRNGRPNRTFSLHDRDAYALGELIMLLEMETVVVAELMGINAFDQPAVEESKILTREYLADLRTADLNF